MFYKKKSLTRFLKICFHISEKKFILNNNDINDLFLYMKMIYFYITFKNILNDLNNIFQKVCYTNKSKI